MMAFSSKVCAVFHAGRDLAEAGQQLDLDRRHTGCQAEFAQLSGVAGGAAEPDQIVATFF